MRAPPEPEDLGGGIFSVPVPIPGNPLAYTLVYAVDSRPGPVLVDAGWHHPQSWAALSSGLAFLGFDVADAYGVIVTHHHPDHSGLAGRVRAVAGAWIAMHAADADIIRRFRQIGPDGWRAQELAALRRAGASEAEITEAREWRGRIDPPALPDRELADRELADLPGRRLRVIWTPGHSPGHICLHLEDGDRLFTGDHVLPRITPNIGLYGFDRPDADPLGDFLSSLALIAELDVAEALPAHQYRFTDIGGRIRVIAAHHEERLAEVMAILDACTGSKDAQPEAAQHKAAQPEAAQHEAAQPGAAQPGDAQHGDAQLNAQLIDIRPAHAGQASAGPQDAGPQDAGAGGATGHDSRYVTLWAVASRMSWKVPWTSMRPMVRRMAAAEAAAHLRLLERRGHVRLAADSDQLRYTSGR
jgi:glyoxylase-like metal-dependent hydrolase (beta-lactamase superfamily II)